MFSDKAVDYIHEQDQLFKEKNSKKLVVVLFYYSNESWLMSFCGNVVELVEKYKVYNDDDFIEWKDTNVYENINNCLEIEVYIEKKIIPQLEKKPLIIIDAAIGDVSGNKVGILFLKKDSNVYG